MQDPDATDLAMDPAMDLDGLERLAASQRAHRRYADTPVDDELLDRLLRVATRAPSAANSQPCLFVTVTDPAGRAAVGEIVATAWRAGGRTWSERHLSGALLDEVDQGATGGIASAPTIIVVCGDASRSPRPALGASVFPAVQNLLLAATAAGLGSAMTTLGADDPSLHRLLGLDEMIVPMAIIPLGHPAVALGPNRREPPRVLRDPSSS